MLRAGALLMSGALKLGDVHQERPHHVDRTSYRAHCKVSGVGADYYSGDPVGSPGARPLFLHTIIVFVKKYYTVCFALCIPLWVGPVARACVRKPWSGVL